MRKRENKIKANRNLKVYFKRASNNEYNMRKGSFFLLSKEGRLPVNGPGFYKRKKILRTRNKKKINEDKRKLTNKRMLGNN